MSLTDDFTHFGRDSGLGHGDLDGVRAVSSTVTSALTTLQAELEHRSANSTAELLANTAQADDYKRLVKHLARHPRWEVPAPPVVWGSPEPTPYRPTPAPPQGSPLQSPRRRPAQARVPGSWTAMGYGSPVGSGGVQSPYKPAPTSARAAPATAGNKHAGDSHVLHMHEMLHKCQLELQSVYSQLQAVTAERDGLLELLLAMQVRAGWPEPDATSQYFMAGCKAASGAPRRPALDTRTCPRLAGAPWWCCVACN